MKDRNNLFTATLVALAFTFAPVVQAGPRLDGGPSYLASKIVNANSDAGAKFGQPTDILPVASISFAPVELTLNQTRGSASSTWTYQMVSPFAAVSLTRAALHWFNQ